MWTDCGHNDIVVSTNRKGADDAGGLPMSIPGFDKNGNLPPGEHLCTWSGFARRFGQNRHRQALLSGLLAAVRSLKAAGSRDVWIDGSFVTSAPTPGDWDGCYGITGIDVSKLDPVLGDLVDMASGRRKQKAKFRGEFVPAILPGGGGRTMLDFFQTDRDGHAKCIIKIEMDSVP